MHPTPAIRLPLTESEAYALHALLTDDRPLLERLLRPRLAPASITTKLHVELYNYRPARNKL